VIGAKIIVDPSTKLSRGYGFVKFSSQAESQKALYEMNGKYILGKPIKTKYVSFNCSQASFKKNSDANESGNSFNSNLFTLNAKRDSNTSTNLNNFYMQKSNDDSIFNLTSFYQNNGIDTNYYTQFYKYYFNINKNEI
jgi:RNA recognition motif-containing protein